MNKTLKALAVHRSALESLKTQGRTLLQRGNVSMEEVDSFITVADAVLSSTAPAIISATVTEGNPDPDAKMELAVMEVDRQLESTNVTIDQCDSGPIPPADAVVSMDDDDVEQIDTLIDEAEELDALAEYGYSIQADDGLNTEVAVEHYKALVVDCFKRTDVSFEAVATADSIPTLVGEVVKVRDIAESIIKKVSDNVSTVSVESIADKSSKFHTTVTRAHSHTAAIAARKEETANELA